MTCPNHGVNEALNGNNMEATVPVNVELIELPKATDAGRGEKEESSLVKEVTAPVGSQPTEVGQGQFWAVS